MSYHTIPRVTSKYPMGVELPAGAPVPVGWRDDLDPYAPPAEYADGRVSWSGYATREARDAARVERAEMEKRARQEAATMRAKRRAEAESRVRGNIAEAMRRCDHQNAVEDRDVYCYTGSVAVEPYTHENRAAHGNITVTDRCQCGAARARLVNGIHQEFGPWSIDEDAVRDRAGQ